MRIYGVKVALLAGALCAASCIQSRAADPGPYLSVDAGVNIMNDVDFDILGGTLTAEMSPGFRGSAAAGYRFTPMIAAELESGFMFNDVDEISGPGGGGSVDDVVLSQAPILAKIVFRYENESAFIPFVAAGVGGVASFLSVDDSGTDDSDSDFVFAWQLQAGVHYKINEQMSAGITYKYLGTDSPEFDIDGVGLEFDSVHNHSILGSFNWSF